MFSVTEAMIEAAQDAYDVAEADRMVALRKQLEAAGDLGLPLDEYMTAFLQARSRWLIAEASRDYAWAVLVSARSDRQAVAS